MFISITILSKSTLLAGVFFLGGEKMVITFCDNCLQPLLDDPNYTVERVEPSEEETREKDWDACFICGRHGHDYAITKNK